jgi:hypothetical protein
MEQNNVVMKQNTFVMEQNNVVMKQNTVSMTHKKVEMEQNNVVMRPIFEKKTVSLKKMRSASKPADSINLVRPLIGHARSKNGHETRSSNGTK